MGSKNLLKMHETHSIEIMEKSTCLSQLHIQKAEHLPKVIKRTFLLKFPTKNQYRGKQTFYSSAKMFEAKCSIVNFWWQLCQIYFSIFQGDQ
jgi:hypothetical protein